jgi:hypothetical protein
METANPEIALGPIAMFIPDDAALETTEAPEKRCKHESHPDMDEMNCDPDMVASVPVSETDVATPAANRHPTPADMWHPLQSTVSEWADPEA